MLYLQFGSNKVDRVHGTLGYQCYHINKPDSYLNGRDSAGWCKANVHYVAVEQSQFEAAAA